MRVRRRPRNRKRRHRRPAHRHPRLNHSRSEPKTGFFEPSISKALARAHELSGVDDWSIHDLRRTVTSGMASLGVQLPVLAAVLNHSPGQVMGITAVYNRHRYSQEKREAVQRWADHVEEIL